GGDGPQGRVEGRRRRAFERRLDGPAGAGSGHDGQGTGLLLEHPEKLPVEGAQQRIGGRGRLAEGVVEGGGERFGVGLGRLGAGGGLQRRLQRRLRDLVEAEPRGHAPALPRCRDGRGQPEAEAHEEPGGAQAEQNGSAEAAHGPGRGTAGQATERAAPTATCPRSSRRLRVPARTTFVFRVPCSITPTRNTRHATRAPCVPPSSSPSTRAPPPAAPSSSTPTAPSCPSPSSRSRSTTPAPAGSSTTPARSSTPSSPSPATPCEGPASTPPISPASG